jgi:hypothetical protein
MATAIRAARREQQVSGPVSIMIKHIQLGKSGQLIFYTENPGRQNGAFKAWI